MIRAIFAAFLSRKLLATGIAAALLIWFHHRAIVDLERLPPEKAASLVTIFTVTSGTLGALLIGYLGFNTLQTRFGLSGVAQALSEHKVQRTETVDLNKVREFAERYRDDPSYAPLLPEDLK